MYSGSNQKIPESTKLMHIIHLILETTDLTGYCQYEVLLSSKCIDKTTQMYF